MPRRAVPADLTPERRKAIVGDLRFYKDRQRQAELEKLVYVAMAFAAGMPLEEIAEAMDISKNTAHRWKDEGERERERRRRGDPVGP